MEEREAIASLLMDHIKNNDVKQVEECLHTGSRTNQPTKSQWRDVIRYEFSIQALMEYTLRYDVIAPRLLAYDIVSLSPFLYAALKGHDDILINLIEHDVPVDMTIESGTAALHLAAFAGKVSTIRMLVGVYKADVNKQDKYGWSALHYASSEGHLEAAEALVECGINPNLRDKDGTSAAFRADINGYHDVVCYLCQTGEEDELLNVDPAYEGRPPPEPVEAIYAKVDKSRKKPPAKVTKKPVVPEDDYLTSKAPKVAVKSDTRPVSEILMSSGRPWDSLPGRIKKDPKMTVRRLIRKELLEALKENFGLEDDGDGSDEDDEPDYERPLSFRKDSKDAAAGSATSGVGMDTLKGIMREEAIKFIRDSNMSAATLPRTAADQDKKDSDRVMSPLAKSMSLPNGKQDDNDYDDLYETVRHLQKAPRPAVMKASVEVEDDIPAAPPPLPPRNADMALLFTDGGKSPEEPLPGSKGDPNVTLTLQRAESLHLGENAALKAAFQRIAPRLGSHWKKLAHALPLESTAAKVNERIASIEKKNPGDYEKQANVALVEWRINHGFKKGTDDIIIALRKCNMHPLIEEVEKASQEFTA